MITGFPLESKIATAGLVSRVIVSTLHLPSDELPSFAALQYCPRMAATNNVNKIPFIVFVASHALNIPCPWIDLYGHAGITDGSRAFCELDAYGSSGGLGYFAAAAGRSRVPDSRVCLLAGSIVGD